MALRNILAYFRYSFSEIEGKDVAELRFNILRSTYEIVPVSSSIARDSALLRLHQNIPVADSIIAATALEKDRIVITDDPHFPQLSKIKVKWIR
jgi:predicted nucleic acid-binding protein